MPDWQQLGPVKVKVVGGVTLVTENSHSEGWEINIFGIRNHIRMSGRFATEARAMAAADAIYDPPPKPIEAIWKRCGSSFWANDNGLWAVIDMHDLRHFVSFSNGNRAFYYDLADAEAAAAKYVGDKA